mgnify:CR=1 FL=1
MLDLTKENFEAEVLKAEGKVFVDFYGDGCVTLRCADALCTRVFREVR